MTLHVTDPVAAQVQDVLPLSPNLYRPEVDTSSIDLHKLKRKIDFSTFAVASYTLPRVLS